MIRAVIVTNFANGTRARRRPGRSLSDQTGKTIVYPCGIFCNFEQGLITRDLVSVVKVDTAFCRAPCLGLVDWLRGTG